MSKFAMSLQIYLLQVQSMFIKREISYLITEYLKYFPVVCVTCPRQSGKQLWEKISSPIIIIIPLWIQNFFLRDKTGHEIDLLVKSNETTFIEIKSGMTIKDEHLKNLIYYSGIIEHDAKYIVYQGEQKPRVKEINITNWIRFLNSMRQSIN